MIALAIKHVLHQTLKLLSFQKANLNIRDHRTAFIIIAIIFAWVAGIGRYWDHPAASWWQYAGLGSVAYIFVLALILWILVMPLGPKKWSYINILIFIGLTSPLAWIYAIPVEKFWAPEIAAKANVNFLIAVALWRVTLYAIFLWHVASLRYTQFLAALFLPLVLILLSLTALNLEHAIFELMAGIDRSPTQRDLIYARIVMLSMSSVFASPIILVVYIIGIARTQAQKYKAGNSKL